MGEVIRLAERRDAPRLGGRRARLPATAVFHFDLACAFSYLALERVDRLMPGVRWQPTLGAALHRGMAWSDPRQLERARDAAERRARELRLPLVWPARHPATLRAAMRAALCAARQARGGAFALAAGRLAFCGGYDLDDPEVLAEAAAAAGVGLDACLRAAGDAALDDALEAPARRLLAAGAERLPAIRTGRVLHCGERNVSAAAQRVTVARGSRTG